MMIKPIYKIIFNKLDIIGYYLIIPLKVDNYNYLFSPIKKEINLPNDICNYIINFLPKSFNLYLRVDIPNTYPLNSLYLSYKKIENIELFPDINFNNTIEYFEYKIKNLNTKYCHVDNRINIDFDYLRKRSIDYMKCEINNIFSEFTNQILFLY